MSVKALPEILKIPRKLLSLIDPQNFNKYNYFLLEGGRGSAKTQTFARFLLYLGDKKKLRIVCGRETQNSIEESVYSVFADLIRDSDLNYNIMSSEIRHVKTGTVIRFRGFREQGKQNIKGLEGVDILWVDEGQAITKETLDIVVPTIRKKNSKVFFSMNRETETDAIYDEFWDRDDCLHITINYLENEYCPEKLLDEAERCKKRNFEDYKHIWLGQPRRFGGIVNVVPKNIYDELQEMEITAPIKKRILTGDPSLGGDECVAYIMDEVGKRLDTLIMHERDTMKIAGKWVQFANRYGVKDFVIDRTGFKGICDRIRELSPKCNMIECVYAGESSRPKEYANIKTEMYMYTADQVFDKNVVYFDDPEMIKQLTDVRIINLTSRKIRTEDKKDFRKRNNCSSDRADAYVQGIWGLQQCKPFEHWREDKYDPYEDYSYDINPMTV